MTVLDPEVIADEIRGLAGHDAPRFALRQLWKGLRRADRFASVWAALGGTQGVVDIMADSSVRDVKALCRCLALTASAPAARAERQARLAELVRLLTAPDAPDKRPMRCFYQEIVPASTEELAMEWERGGTKWTLQQRRWLWLAHPVEYKQKFLEEIFSPDFPDLSFEFHRLLYYHNWDLTKAIFKRLIDAKEDVHIPRDFMSECVNRQLERCLKRRYDDSFRREIFGLAVQCVQKHQSLADQLNLSKYGFLALTVDRWARMPSQRLHFQKYIAVLISVLPSREFNGSASARAILQFVPIELRYTLLRIILLSSRRYNVDIEEPSGAGLVRLGNLLKEDGWAADFFSTTLGAESGTKLFQRLWKLYPDASFLLPAYGGQNTVLKQTRSSRDHGGDPEVLYSVLVHGASDSNTIDTVWSQRVEASVQERRRKAAQSRQWEERAFWAASALRLCVASRDLELYRDTLLWSRRFNKDGRTYSRLCAADVLATDEGKKLLVALPEPDGVDLASNKSSVEAANSILLLMAETATMVQHEPTFQASDWRRATDLVNHVVDERCRRTSARERGNWQQAEILEQVWKPTIAMLLALEKLTIQSGLSQGSLRYFAASLGAKLSQKVHPSVRVEITTYVMDGMNRELGPERTRFHTRSLVEIVRFIAEGSQPAWAWPYIRSLVLDDNDNSSWHRQILRPSFLKQLPAKKAREFLSDIADAIRERLEEQNSRARQPKETLDADSAESRRYVKVTTVKMLAGLLREALFIDAATACGILTSLLPHARHVDIHHAVVESLLAMYRDPAATVQLRDDILSALESHTVPLAAQLNDRRPMTEEDWVAAEATRDAPMPHIFDDNGTPPILDLLLPSEASTRPDQGEIQLLVRLVVPTFTLSAKNNSRWMRLFLEKNGFSLPPDDKLPSTPVHLSLLLRLLGRWAKHIPRTVLDTARQLVLANLRPSAAMASVTRAVRDRPELARSNAGQHWLKQFGNPRDEALSLGARQCAQALAEPDVWPSRAAPGGITIHALQKFVLETADVLIAAGDTKMCDILTESLRLSRLWMKMYPNGRLRWENWRTRSVPVLEEIVRRIEAHGGAVQGRAARVDTFFQRLVLLPFPCYDKERPATEEEDAEFVDALSRLVDHIVDRKLPYHEHWKMLKADVCRSEGRVNHAIWGARLGSLDRFTALEASVADYLRVELAADLLLAEGAPQKEEVVEATRRVIKQWKESDVDEFRARGVSVSEELLNIEKGGTWG